MLDIDLYKQKVKDSGLKKSAICKELGLTYQGLWRKEQGLTDFKAKEISKICKLIKLTAKEREQIFFAKVVG